METGKTTFSTTWLYGMLIVGGLLGATISYLLNRNSSLAPCPDPPVVKLLSCFDADEMNAMLGTSGRGVRFYIALDYNRLAVLAAPIGDDGAHIPDASGVLQFRLYERISGSTTMMKLLDEANARNAVMSVKGQFFEPWSIDAEKSVLDNLLSTNKANGIGVVQGITTEGERSFELVPVVLNGDSATALDPWPDNHRIGAPCPMHCPKEAFKYLHRQ